MRKRLLSWLLVLAMVTSLIPSTLVTALAAELPSAQASGQAGKTTVEFDNKWPGDMNADITDVLITGTTIPGPTLTVEKGKTLIVHGSGTLSGSGRKYGTPFFIVEDGGHLVLDNVTITANVSAQGTVVVKKGGLLDLGYNDRKDRIAPSITGNTTTGNLLTQDPKNLVVVDGATVRLNAAAEKKIGVTGVNADSNKFSGDPISVIEGGRYTIRGNNDTMENEETMIEADSATLDLDISSGSPYSDINKTGTKLTLQYVNDHLVLVSSRINVLVWDPIRYWSNSEKNSTTYDGAIFKLINTLGTGNLYGNLYRNGTPSSPRHMNQQDIAAFEQFDMIVLNYPTIELNQEEINGLNDFLCNGGRIFMQFENPNTNAKRKEIILKGQKIANALKAEFEIDDTKWVAENANVDVNDKAALSKGLTNHKSGKAGYIFSKSDSLTWIFSGKTTTGETSLIVCDQNAGDKNGEKWGALTICGDGVYFDKDSTKDQNQLKNGKKLLENLLQSSRKNRLIAATGVNPNAKFNPQATTTDTTPYRTPYTALQKAVETNTVTLLTESCKGTGLTPTRDELLFEKSTLAYEKGSTYADSTIHADTAGVYLDITKTGEVNLRDEAGTVTVTPKDKNYVLTLGGTMDETGTQIDKGYKITSATKYQLIADDPTSPILPQNGGKASIVIPQAGESVTVDYGGGKTVTYTAKTANDKIYLGWYQVKKQTPANMTWTDADKAWHGHTFTTTLEPNVGYEINGENLTIADTDNAMTGGYTLKKQGDAAADPNDNTISWTTYSTDDGKVTVKQQHLHSGGSDRNGIAILTVNDVHADISIGAGDNTVNAKAPTIYVVGIGKRTDHADVQLWEYTTVRNTKDGILDKPVSGWPWEKWKVSSAASGNGTESDYKQNKVTLTSDATKLDTSSETAQYTINLETGDKVVVFYYDWNMTEVTIKATDANGNPIPDYTDQVVEYEIGKQTTITAPNLIGYQPVGGQNTKDFTPSETNKEITFQYEKTTGNLIYKAVYVDAAGAKRELGTFSGGTLVQGQAPNKSAQYAPQFDNYELADKTADGVASAESYTGTDITVTYTYKAKVKTIPVEAYVDSTNGVRLLNDTTTYKDITTGQTITVTAPDIAGYKVKGAASQTVFVTNDTSDGQKVVFLYEKDNDNDAYVLVKLVDSSNGDKLISSYQVPGVKDKAQLIKAPAAPYGYKADPTYKNEDKTVTPTGPKAPYTAEVVFKYVPNVHTVTIKLEDVSETPAKPLTVNNYVTSYKVVDGEGLTITAPSIYGYTMAANAAAVKQLTNITKDETVTFEYEPIDKQMVYIHVKGVGPGSNTLFESRESVTHGTASKEVNVFTLPGLKLASATVGGTDKTNKVANGKLTVDLTSVTKGGTVDVVLNYESNMANVTVKAMYNGQPLQSYTTSLEKGVPATINAPSVPGYTAREQNKQLTPNGDTEVEFIYTKDNGNITIIVTADGTELYRKDGGTVANGSKITLTGDAAAPTIEYYTTPTAPKSVLVGSTEVKDTLATYQYDGVGDIIVTYEYTRKTQDVTIIKKDENTKKEITRETLQSLPVGKSHTFADGSVAVPNNYQAVTDRNPTSYFVEDKPNQTVTFWYKNTSADQYAQVTVNLKCDGKVFQSYPVTAIKGVSTTIQAPTWTGYELKTGTQASATVTPDGTPDNDKVEFEYTIKNPKTVTVVLKDNSNTANPDATLKAPAGYTTSYTLKEGDSVEIWAPSIDGYTLMSATLGDTATQEKQFVKANYAALANGETVVTFRYFPVTQANFVKHTVKFMLGDHLLYSHEKMIAKGSGTPVPYSGDDVKYMVPGYAYNSITYEVNGVDAPTAANVTDAVNATIIYHFVEDAATVTIKKSGTSEQDTVLTGYRKGQTVQVVAPVVSNYALTGDLIQTVTLNGANTDVTFNYVAAGQVTFILKELNADGTEGSIIAVINGEAGKTYDAKATDGNPLDLSKYGYTYTPSNLTSAPFNVGGAGKVENLDLSQQIKYEVYYSKDLRTVDYVSVDKAKLDKDGKTLDDVKNDPTELAKYTIKVAPVTPEKARVGETYKAVAQSFNGWALKDDFSKLYQVEKSTESLKVYFLYEQKTTGTVTVHYHFGEGADNKGKLINEYSITAVAGEKVQISALEYFNDNKYHLRKGQTNPYVLTVTDQAETVDFYYEANFVVVTAKTVVDGGNATTHETYEVIKDLTTHSGSTTLYPPEKAGYTLVGITADGATLNNGGADQLPTEYADNKLNLAGLTQDATVTYYYKTTKASEYQTTLTVEYKYNGYDLATHKTINANTGEENFIDIPAFDGYKASTYDFKDGSNAPVTGAGISGTGTTVSVTPAEKTATLTITYTRPDGSIELPGKDGSMTTPKDNVLVTPDNHPVGNLDKKNDGSVEVKGDGATVNRPKDPNHLDQGKENIKVPEGTIVKPDGTIILPGGGGTINPDGKLPGATPTGYISVVYKANGGTGDDVIDLIKNGQPINARANPFTNGSQTFTGWNTADNGVGGTAYGAGDEITIPNSGNTITLYAQWGKAEYKHTAKITYQANDGVTNAIEDTVGANDSTKFSINLRSNPFSVSGWDFGGWNTEANGTGTLKAANALVEVTANNNQTWYAQWYKVGANGSITVPGDGNPNTTGDNVTANGTGVTRDTTTGNIEIPAGGNAVKGNGETIALPNGGTLKPDGTLIIDKPNGGQIEVKPDGSTDANVVTLTYEANNGTNDTRKVYTTKGEAIAPLAADTFSYRDHAFLYWKSGDTIFKTNGTITPTEAMTLFAVWAKANPDGSIELPGTDGKLEAPDNKDNVIVTPDKPNGEVTPQPDGSVKVEDNGGTVTRPTDPKHPETGKEEIKVPEGTVVEPDGTIKLPDGTVIDPDKRIPDDVTPTNYFVVTYVPGDGSGDVIRDVITKNADTTLRDEDTFTAPNGKIFDGWLDGAQTKHDAGKPLMVSESMTFTAQWKDGTPTPPAPKYSATIVFDPNTGDATATQTVTSADSTTITHNFDAYTQHFTAPAGWTFMGWSTKQVASQSSSFYADGAEETLKDGDTLNLYAILYKLDADTKVITLPGKGGQPEGGDDVTVTPGAGADLTVDKGFIKAPAGSEIKQPANATPIKVIEGEVNVYPDGTVYVPEGSKVQLPDGSEIKGETTIDPDGTPDVDNTKPVQKPDGTIVLPGQNGVIGTGDDDITIAPAGPNQPAGRIDEDGNVTITNPSGADVNIPGSDPADFKVPNGTVIKPNGDMTLLYTIRYVDGSGTEIKTATVKPVQRGIPETVEAATITGYTVSGEATKTASGEVSANLADYTITFNYTKNSSGGGGSAGGGSIGGGGGGGGSSTVSSYTIKASAGNGGNISPSGNVTVARGKDQSFHINPINGYRISDVIVDGKSVGAVSTYTFDSVKANHTIEVKFAKLNAIVADPETTGVAGWLQTKEHNGYMGGYGNGLFGPNDNMTRAQVARMFYNLLLEKDVPVTVSFTDVPADAWYAEAVNTLASLDVIKGIGDGQFAPNRTITRAEFTVIAMRFANVSADVTNPFTDIATNDWYYTAVTSAVSYGWINGYSDGSFRPQATITRAEVVTIVNRMLNRTADRNFVDSNATAQFDDVPNTYWAYYNIMEATIAHDHSIDNDGVESWGKQK